jgi:hypothetical protein
VREEQARERVARERRFPGEALEEDAAERVLVGAAVEGSSGHKLRGGVLGRTHEAGVVPLGVGGRLSQPEVGEIRVTRRLVGDEHVRGLDVAVHEPVRVRGIEGLSDGAEQVERPLRVERSVPLEHTSEVRAGDVAHGDVQEVARLARLVDRHDVRVLEARGQLGLAQEALAEARVLGKARREQLERHLASEARILGEVHVAHAAASHESLDPVAGEVGPDPRVRVQSHVQRRVEPPRKKRKRLGGT